MEDKYQKYKNIAFTNKQWLLIKQTIDEGIDVEPLANPALTLEQMEILIDALKQGIDIYGIADPNFSVKQMERLIEKISKEMGLYNEHYEKVRRMWLANTSWLITMIIILMFAVFILFATQDDWIKYFSQLDIELTTDVVTLEQGSVFEAGEYVKAFDTSGELILPDTSAIDTSNPGSYCLTYTVTNGRKKIDAHLLVNIE